MCEPCFAGTIEGKLCGVLEKKHPRNPNFQHRLIMLDTVNQLVEYYLLDDVRQPKGDMHLSTSCSVRELNNEEQEHYDVERAFVLVTPDREFMFRAMDGDYKIMWIKRLECAINPTAVLMKSQQQRESALKRLASNKLSVDMDAFTVVAEITAVSVVEPFSDVEITLPEEAVVEPEEEPIDLNIIDAAKEGRLDVVKRLIESKADLEQKDEHGGTALLWASRDGCSSLAELLINAKADVNSKNNYGKTCLIYASRGESLDTVRMLLENGAQDAGSAMIMAATEGATSLVEHFTRLGVDVESKDKHGATALIWAAQGAHCDTVYALLASGADPRAQNKYGKSALEYAQRTTNEELIEMLTEAAKKMDEGDNYSTCIFSD